MRAAAAWALVSLLALASCGYVGPVLPPSPQLAVAVGDLTVVERGDQLVIGFTTPPSTTDNLPVRLFSEIDLRIGPSPRPFDFERWAASAMHYPLEPPAEADPENPRPIAMSKIVPAKDWVGQHIAIAVRTAVKHKDHYSAWSNRVVLDVVPPLAAPVITAEATVRGVEISWPGQAAELKHRIYRQSATDKAPVEAGTSDGKTYLDATAQYDTRYEYTAVAFQGAVQSLPSKDVSITPIDKFPPSVPAGLTALAGPLSIELSWQRSPESDLKGYYVYRSENGAPFQQLGDLVTLPTLSDRRVEHGKTYRYEVSAVDKKNNQSERSAPREVTF